MTNIEPPVELIYEYGIVWTLKKGDAIYTECGDEGDLIMSRNNHGIPIIPQCEGGESDDDGDDDSESDLSYFHTTYMWEDVEISYRYDNKDTDPLIGFEIAARVYRLIKNVNQPGETEDEEEYTFAGWVPYRVNSASIKSKDPNTGGTWVYPDDYDVEVDENHPTQYGGVITFTEGTPVDLEPEEKFVLGIDSGLNETGYVYWRDTSNNLQRTFSGYNYMDVFDENEFAYIPRNTYENKELEKDEDFEIEPYYPSVKDPNNLAAPIYPMNAITSFVPDLRELVTVTYIVNVNIDVLNDEGKPIDGATPINTYVTIVQNVLHNTDDYIEQLEGLQSLCMFSNPGEWKLNELSPNYNYDYPYTLVTGFEGVPIEGETYVRGDDKNNEPLERGDVLYDTSTNIRKIWSIADIPERLSIIDGGSNYRDAKNVTAIKVYEMDKSFNPERYPAGRPPRGYEKIDMGNAVGLLVDTETKDGKIVSIKISKDIQPSGWQDNDIVRITGGSGDAVVRIHIDNPPGWSNKFIDKY